MQLPECTRAGVTEGAPRAGGQRGITGAGGRQRGITGAGGAGCITGAGRGQGAAAELAWLLSRPWCGGEGVSLSEGQSLYSRFQLFSDGS